MGFRWHGPPNALSPPAMQTNVGLLRKLRPCGDNFGSTATASEAIMTWILWEQADAGRSFLPDERAPKKASGPIASRLAACQDWSYHGLTNGRACCIRHHPLGRG